VVADARIVLRKAETIKNDAELSEQVELLKRILREHMTEEDGTPREKVRKEKPPDLLVLPVDPDARFGAKLIAPLRTRNNITRAVFPKRMFDYNATKNTLTCPAGVTIPQSFHDHQKNIRMFHFPLTS